MKHELTFILLLLVLILSFGCIDKVTERKLTYEDENIKLTYPDWKPLELSENQLVKVTKDYYDFLLLHFEFDGDVIKFATKFEEEQFGHQGYIKNLTGIGDVRGNELFLSCGVAVTSANVSYYECLAFVSCNKNIYTIMLSRNYELMYNKKIFDDILKTFECKVLELAQ